LFNIRFARKVCGPNRYSSYGPDLSIKVLFDISKPSEGSRSSECRELGLDTVLCVDSIGPLNVKCDHV
jgi:hypothetical protein